MGKFEQTYKDAEWRVPPIQGFLDATFFGPILIYFIIFYATGQWIRSFAWKNYTPFIEYRLRNTTVSLIHSTITGGCSLLFMLLNSKVMFEDTLHWYTVWGAQLVYISMGYFIYDILDVLSNERSRYAYEVTLHHVAVFSIFSVGMLAHKFLPYAFWALLVEVNCVFLHLRSLLQITQYGDTKYLWYRIVKFLSFATFIMFRFGALIWMFKYMALNRQHFHAFYSASGLTAVSFFLILSTFLFFRTFSNDELSSRDQSAIKRDFKQPALTEECAKLS